nr:unnamed protein product [Digitaria exilis]
MAVASCFCFCSSSSIVSDMLRPFVSGRHAAKSPEHPMQSPNTPKDQKLRSRPSATSTGAATPPSTSACRTIPTAELRTDVGNSSMELNAVMVAKKESSSAAILAGDPSGMATHMRLNAPAVAVSTITVLRRFTLPMNASDRMADGSSAIALYVTLMYRFVPRLPTLSGIP